MNSTASLIASTLGWVGAAGTIGAYALVSRGSLKVTSIRFQLLNVVGAAFLATSAVAHANWASAASNVLWMICGLPVVVIGVRQALVQSLRDRVRPLSARGPAPIDIVDQPRPESAPTTSNHETDWDDTGTMVAIPG